MRLRVTCRGCGTSEVVVGVLTDRTDRSSGWRTQWSFQFTGPHGPACPFARAITEGGRQKADDSDLDWLQIERVPEDERTLQ